MRSNLRFVFRGELIRFGLVGAATFLIDTALFYGLKLTILEPKPVTAKVFAVVIATVVSYVLNREWSFRARGGRERHHEASLYFAFSAVGVALYSAPLWVSRYAFGLQTPHTSLLVQEIADFTAGQIVGVLLGMAFRWWAFRKWVFPPIEQASATTAPHVEDAAQRSAPVHAVSAGTRLDLPRRGEHVVGARDGQEDVERRWAS